MKPYPYQERGIQEILQEFKTFNKVCYQLSTGGGKTAIFSFLTKHWVENENSNVLILCHRTELIEQTEKTLAGIGIGSEPVVAKVKRLKQHSRVYISMVETANNRLNKNPYFFPNIGLIIVDECHILVFGKVTNRFPDAKLLGCTATPCVLKRVKFWRCPYCRAEYTAPSQCCDEEVQEWSRPFSLSKIYDTIVVGPTIDELITFGSIVKELSFIKHYTDDSKLKTDSDGEFTTESVDQEYGSENAVFNVFLNYKELCTGKKTIIFNSSAKSNLALYERFRTSGIQNVRMYDSVNKEHSGNRAELLEWFANTPDAVLLNVGVFTTGFDSREVEAIIINRPTGSLSLFLQIAGRGGRSSNLIYKDHFILIDGGGNIDRFNEWSYSGRDWREIFFKGNGKEKAKAENAIDIHPCPECGYLYPKSQPECPECGYQIPEPPPRSSQVVESNEVLVPIRKIPPPNGERIYTYTISRGGDINFAFKIMLTHITDMFRYYKVTKPLYEKSLNTGELDRKLAKMIRSCYFVLLKKPDIQTPGNRTIQYLVDKSKEKLKIYYESR